MNAYAGFRSSEGRHSDLVKIPRGDERRKLSQSEVANNPGGHHVSFRAVMNRGQSQK
jgi:hypothetical protein